MCSRPRGEVLRGAMGLRSCYITPGGCCDWSTVIRPRLERWSLVRVLVLWRNEIFRFSQNVSSLRMTCFVFFFFFLFLCYLLTTLRIRYPGVRYSRFTFELSYVVCMFFFYEFAMGCAHNSFSIKLIVETKLSFLFFFLVTSMIDHFNMYILNFFVNFGVIAFKCNWWNTPIGIQVSLENVLPPRTYEITVYICNTMPTTIFTWTKIIGIIPYCITLRDHFSKAQDISS